MKIYDIGIRPPIMDMFDDGLGDLFPERRMCPYCGSQTVFDDELQCYFCYGCCSVVEFDDYL